MKVNQMMKFVRNHPESLKSRITPQQIYARFWFYARQNIWPFLAALFMIFCLSALQILLPQVTRYTIDMIIPKQQFDLLPWVGVIILLISCLTGIFDFLRSYLMAVFGHRTIDILRRDLYQHLQQLSVSFFEHQRTGDLMSRLVQDVHTIGNLATADLGEIIADLCVFLVIILYILTTDWELALLLLTVWPIVILVTQYFSRSIRKIHGDIQVSAAAINNHIQDTISNINVIKSFGNEQYEINRFTKYSHHYQKLNIRVIKLWSFFFPLVDILKNTSSIVVLVFGSREVMLGRLTLGELAAFLSYISLVNQPLKRLSRVMNVWQSALAAADRILEILDTKPEVVEANPAINLSPSQGSIYFENVSFAYTDQVVIHDFNLHIYPGMMVALVGSSGAGKSTIAKLLARFYDPQVGKIYLDHHDLREISWDSLRKEVGIVSQENLLFYGTIRENIAYGKLDATDQEIIAAAQVANAHEFITKFPLGYDTTVGERGIKLSGGQKQRLAIARVLLKNPQFIILDEATSALDTESESLIQQSLQQIFQGRTSLVIAHRLSTIQQADLIVVMEDGKIVETGTHEALLAEGGRYAVLYGFTISSGGN